VTTYKFIGDGAGVPGLPHEIPEEEAAQYGQPLQEAIKSGLYAPVGAQDIAPGIAPAHETKRKSKASETAKESDQ
jgi:hypothetical protein